ncbi:sugar phosphate isomerase/epimerase, partial [[Clostridium] scindens]|nr:sugar phosphate isomerase/epimerase [[Clostridium] scindens]
KPFQHVAFDMGDIDFMMIFSNLRKYGYENAVSLEAETDYNETLKSMKRMQDWVTLSDNT